MWPFIKGDLGLRDLALVVVLVVATISFGLNPFYSALVGGGGLFIAARFHKEAVSVSSAIEALKIAFLGLVLVGGLAWLNNQSLVDFVNNRTELITDFLCSFPVALASYGVAELITSIFVRNDSEV
jgi:hypothetical protein